jgi:hypothetical protein
MQPDFQFSIPKVVTPLNVVDTQNQDKFKMALDRLEEKVLWHILNASKTDHKLSLIDIRRAFDEARFWVK